LLFQRLVQLADERLDPFFKVEVGRTAGMQPSRRAVAQC
jgi:hypothetical protein